MSQASWDAIIVGQGLAGTTLAWHLREAGWKVLVLDACEPVTSSKIAAGLMTPITGKRLATNRRYDEYFQTAKDFYQRIERQTATKFFFERTAVRLFTSDDERLSWNKRKTETSFQAHLQSPQPDPLIDPDFADVSGGGFSMNAAQLDTSVYLESSRDHHIVKNQIVDWQNDVAVGAKLCTVAGHTTRMLISCEGFAARDAQNLLALPFKAAKGDILTIQFEQPRPPICVHAGFWLAPTHDNTVFKAGATYDWDNLDTTPSPSAREKLENQLKEKVRAPFEIIGHHAAVRPIINESKPIFGHHSEHKSLIYFNGLGSKGALLAPWYARALTQHLVNNTTSPIDSGDRTQA